MSSPERDELYEKIIEEYLKSTNKKHEAELKKKVRTKIFFIGIVCATVVLLVVARTLAWMDLSKGGKVSTINTKIQEAPALLIADYPSDGNWKESLSVHFFPLSPLCGNGDNFFAPLIEKVSSSSNGMEVLYKKVVGTRDFENGETLSSSALVKEFQLYSTGPVAYPIYLDPASSVSLDVEESPGSSYNSSGLNTSLIAGAVRVAFYAHNGEDYDLKAIWIPNPNIELIESDGLWVSPSSSIMGDEIEIDGNAENKYYFVSSVGRFDDNTVTSTAIDYSSNGYAIINNVLYFWDTQKIYDDSVYIYDTMSQYSTKRCKIVVWIEGTDRECENALMGGKMGLNLVLTQKHS